MVTRARTGPMRAGARVRHRRRAAGRRDDAHSGAPDLLAAFDPARNSLSVMRVGLAMTVAVAHAMSTGYGHQPHLGRTAIADLAVDGFFVLSGFLVTRSILNLRSVGRYARHRFLRILPGYWTCLLVTAALFAPLGASFIDLAPGSVFTTSDAPAWQYPLLNGALPPVQFRIGDLVTPLGDTTVNGALWTLQYEALAYGVVAGLFALQVLRSRALMVAACGLALAVVVLEAAGGIPYDVPVLDNQNLARFMFVFLLGATGWIVADRIRISGAWAAAAVLLLAPALYLSDYRIVGAIPFAYLCLYGVVRLPLRQNPSWDLSYGLYIYHYPVQFLLAMAGATIWPEAVFVLVSIGLVVPVAALSWWVVERPALNHKDPGRQPVKPVTAR